MSEPTTYTQDDPDEIAVTVAAERAQLARGICPRSGKPIMPNGILRPACSFCECGEVQP